MRKYPLALDAAPQDGRWLDNADNVKTLLQFLMSKLSPSDLKELDDHLTEGTTPQARDHRIPAGKLRDELFLYTPKHRQAMLGAFDNARGVPSVTMTPAERDAVHAKLFPNQDRLK